MNCVPDPIRLALLVIFSAAAGYLQGRHDGRHWALDRVLAMLKKGKDTGDYHMEP